MVFLSHEQTKSKMPQKSLVPSSSSSYVPLQSVVVVPLRSWAPDSPSLPLKLYLHTSTWTLVNDLIVHSVTISADFFLLFASFAEGSALSDRNEMIVGSYNYIHTISTFSFCLPSGLCFVWWCLPRWHLWCGLRWRCLGLFCSILFLMYVFFAITVQKDPEGQCAQ